MTGVVHHFEDVIKHKSRKDCWITVNAKVYDVSRFLDDHPGGDEVLLAASGKDATAEFEAVGHSDDALDLMSTYFIGHLDTSTLPAHPVNPKPRPALAAAANYQYSFVKITILLPFLLLLLGLALALPLRQN